MDHRLRVAAGPEPGVESLNNMVHPPNSFTARPSHSGIQPAFALAALSGILADAPYWFIRQVAYHILGPTMALKRGGRGPDLPRILPDEPK
jgi:hypothetical protein